MNKYRILIYLLLTISNIFGQQIHKQPRAVPAPYQLRENIDNIKIINRLAKLSVGDTTFYLRKNLHSSKIELIEVEFYKLYENDTIVIFGETTEYDENRITDNSVLDVVNSLLYHTPNGSIDPDKGILTNAIEIFGDIPDVDSNGKLYVLLIDVRDDYESGVSDTYVAGYFDPIDQRISQGNYSDIIYIDTNPGDMTAGYTLGIVAHELQHLIHYNYDSDESTWLNEGFSELIPILLGYESHSFGTFLNDTNRKLNIFDGTIQDYSKVGLWTFYIYKRFGINMLKEVLRSSANSLDSYEECLTKLGFSEKKEQLLQDWFIANLINDQSLLDGRYSYYGATLPEINSEHFYPNFTDGIVNGELKPTAAEYVQFYSGNSIELDMNFQQDNNFNLVVIKHFEDAEIKILDSGETNYVLDDPDFGSTYSKLSLILSWTSMKNNSNSLSYSHSAEGIGGVDEEELSFDGDSIAFYLNIGGYMAAETFPIQGEDVKLTAVKFNMNDTSPVSVKIYGLLRGAPINVFSGIIPNYGEWTRYTLPESIDLDGINFVTIALESESSQLSIGYSNTGQGQGRAYLDNGNGFSDLSNFTNSDNQTLTGDWSIRAIIQKNVFRESEMILTPDSIFIWNGNIIQKIKIRNNGTEILNWYVQSNPDWVSINRLSGKIGTGVDELICSVDTIGLNPGIFEDFIVINSNDGIDSVYISVLKKNMQSNQTAFFTPNFFGDQKKLNMEVFNIGQGNGYYSIFNYPEFLGVFPAEGYVAVDDTVVVDLFIDTTSVISKEFEISFFNGLDTLRKSFIYNGELNSIIEKLEILVPAPNPFCPTDDVYTNIRVRLQQNDERASLKLFNILGERVKSFNFQNYTKGIHLFQWDGRNEFGTFAASGIYFLLLEQGDKVATQKMLLLK